MNFCVHFVISSVNMKLNIQVFVLFFFKEIKALCRFLGDL